MQNLEEKSFPAPSMRLFPDDAKGAFDNFAVPVPNGWGGLTWSHRDMRLIVALILPWLTFFTIGRPIAGIVCFLLQITLIGWLPATIWAVYALSQYKTDRKIARALARNPASIR
jgi:uncharacterized membrane protein YqaE (UPF0057 family)